MIDKDFEFLNKIPSPTIHLTDFCNQSCPFCIASSSMPRSGKKQISYEDFKSLVNGFKKIGAINLKLTGGETTLNKDFFKILKYALKKFFFITIFTNGTFSPNIRNLLYKNGSRLFIIVNISTPGFQFNKKLRAVVLNNVKILSKKAAVSLSVVSPFMDNSVFSQFKFVPKSLVKKVGVKLSLQNSIALQKNIIDIRDFPKIGKNICDVIKKLNKIGPPVKYNFEGWMRPCMFSTQGKKILTKNGLGIYLNATRCHSENNHYYHVASDMATFHCYPLSTVNIFKVTKNNLGDLANRYNNLQTKLEKKLILPECRKCPFFGFEEGKCTGPCLGFRINALRKSKTSIEL